MTLKEEIAEIETMMATPEASLNKIALISKLFGLQARLVDDKEDVPDDALAGMSQASRKLAITGYTMLVSKIASEGM